MVCYTRIRPNLLPRCQGIHPVAGTVLQILETGDTDLDKIHAWYRHLEN